MSFDSDESFWANEAYKKGLAEGKKMSLDNMYGAATDEIERLKAEVKKYRLKYITLAIENLLIFREDHPDLWNEFLKDNEPDFVKLEKLIKKILDDCTCPELCLECRRKLHRYINALCCLPDTILTEGL
jgi:hypothetical protein